MVKKIISSLDAPKAVGPYSQAILHSSKYTLEISGQLGIDPQDNKMIAGGVEAQAEQALNNIKAILKEVGWDFNNIVKTRIYLAKIEDYPPINRIYAQRFGDEKYPARAAFAVKDLPIGALIEIECTASGDTVK